MAYTLGNNCAKNLCKRTVLLQLIIENVVTCFLEHSVQPDERMVWGTVGPTTVVSKFICSTRQMHN